MVARSRLVRAEMISSRFWQVGCVLFAQAAVLQHARDGAEELGALERLQQIVGGAAAEGAGGDVDVVHGGQHDYGQAGMVAADDVEQAKTVGAGHHYVGEHQFAAGIVLQMQQGLFGVCRGADVVAAALQQLYDAGRAGRLVVDHQDVLLLARHIFLVRPHISLLHGP